jgi:hypothetical protein
MTVGDAIIGLSVAIIIGLPLVLLLLLVLKVIWGVLTKKLGGSPARCIRR